MFNFLSIIIRCAWCKAILGGDGKPPYSDGICAACEKKHF